MAKKLQLRRGTKAEHSSFTGAEGEVTYDTTNKVLICHDGSQAGGFPMNRAAGEVTAMSANDMDLAEGEYFTKTISGNTTFTFSNIPSGYSGWVFEITNGGTGTVTWPSTVKWGGGQAAVLTASGVDILVFTTDDSGTTVRAGIFSTDNK